jgi:hypothetical protein
MDTYVNYFKMLFPTLTIEEINTAITNAPINTRINDTVFNEYIVFTLKERFLYKKMEQLHNLYPSIPVEILQEVITNASREWVDTKTFDAQIEPMILLLTREYAQNVAVGGQGGDAIYGILRQQNPDLAENVLVNVLYEASLHIDTLYSDTRLYNTDIPYEHLLERATDLIKEWRKNASDIVELIYLHRRSMTKSSHYDSTGANLKNELAIYLASIPEGLLHLILKQITKQ